MLRERLNSVVVLAVAFALVASVAAPLCAGVITGPTTFTNDATSGISSAKTYTQKIDAGNNGAAVTVNGVTFDNVFATASSTSPISYPALNFTESMTYTSTNGWLNASGSFTGISPTTEGSYALLQTMLCPGGYGNLTNVMTLSGLTVGTTYEARLYWRYWSTDDRTTLITFNEGGGLSGSVTVNQDASSTTATWVGYKYTAQATSMTITEAFSFPGAPMHFFALTNEVVGVPEPSTLALLAAGLAGLLCYAWRKRR